MTTPESAPTRAERLSIVRRLLEAVESGDADSERSIVELLGRTQFSELYRELDRIASEMQAALSDVPVNEELARLAHRELPSARLRLNQVIDLTEEAAHQTLAAVEEALPVAHRMATSATEALAEWPAETASGNALRHVHDVLEAVSADAALLRARLSDVMLAQSYQDLTGQIMRPVVRLVSELADTLTQSLGTDATSRSATEERSSKGSGPAVPGLNSGETVSGQQDVDDLMSSLGL
jgi:chemotaxis protein CheZ